MDANKVLEGKLADYRRFTMTLIILSGYLYIGVLISIYEYHSTSYYYLFVLITLLLSTAFYFVKKLKVLQQKLREE
ncbi:YrhC family protein [Halobacillus sp. A1]|uniref:YrhC family protein n=1 Tax=Halobacillus campisalis TaxID=435909 RepID=A0ABW2K463_9BACI|nr:MULTISPECIES: YrhC family protein [Halobacillus]MCP3030396.1 YrhC family protein [Halobacillus sp. A1]